MLEWILILISNLLLVTSYGIRGREVSSIKLLLTDVGEYILEVEDYNKRVFKLKKKVNKSNVWLLGNDQHLQKHTTQVCYLFHNLSSILSIRIYLKES